MVQKQGQTPSLLQSDTASVQFVHILDYIIYNLIVIARHRNIIVSRLQQDWNVATYRPYLYT